MASPTYLQDAYKDVMNGRSASDFSSFDEFWAEFDATMYYDAADNGESVEVYRDDIKKIFYSEPLVFSR